MAPKEKPTKKCPPSDVLDLDLDLKSKKATTKEDSDVLNEETKKEKKKKKKQIDLRLCVPTKEGWIDKNIEDCSGEEFIAWAKEVYPTVTAPTHRFDTLRAKMEAFEMIKKYHYRSLTLEQRKTKH